MQTAAESKKPNGENSTKSFDVQSTLRSVDSALGNDAEKGPIEAELLTPATAEGAIADAAPSAFLLQTVGQLVGKGVELSKHFGWSGPGVEGVFTEAEWQTSVTNYSAIVIQRRWPTLANECSEEVALLVLLIPWLFWSVPQIFKLVFKRESKTGASDSDPRRNGDGQNNANAPIDRPATPGVFN